MLQQQVLTPVLEQRDERAFAPLVAALDAEARLLEELAGTMRRQRQGVAADDVQAVDESVYGSWRVMRTLQEARRRRTLLTEQLLDTDLSPRDWSEALQSTLPDAVCAARERLLATASRVAREIEINRRVLARALRSGEDAVRTLLGAAAPTAAVYGAAATEPAPAASPSFINRQV